MFWGLVEIINHLLDFWIECGLKDMAIYELD